MGQGVVTAGGLSTQWGKGLSLLEVYQHIVQEVVMAVGLSTHEGKGLLLLEVYQHMGQGVVITGGPSTHGGQGVVISGGLSIHGARGCHGCRSINIWGQGVVTTGLISRTTWHQNGYM